MIGQPIPLKDETPKALVECVGCGDCCTSFYVEMDEPKDRDSIGNALWLMYHEKCRLVLLVESDEWVLEVFLPCRNLQPNRSCGIYENRPQTCRDYERETCEVNKPIERRFFDEAGQLGEYVKARWPEAYEASRDQFGC